MIIEIVGYIGSAIVLLSFLMTSEYKLRIVNTLGSFIFMVYALIIKSYPTAIMNFCLVIINIRFLYKMRYTGHQFDLVKVDREDSFLQYLLKKYKEDIDECFPGREEDYSQANACYLISCQGKPAGITIGNEADGVITLLLDYSIPEYRDFSIGKFLFDQLKKEGINKVVYDGPVIHHMAYLNKMEFKEVSGHYERTI